MGDLLGRRTVFLAGLGVFTAASLLCGVSTNAAMLIGARFLQGLGGAATTAVVLGMIVTVFPEPSAQARPWGVYSFVAAAGGTIGLLLGGVLTQALNWHWIFFVNVPIGLITAILTVRVVERDRGLGLAGGADTLGAMLITGALMLGVYTIVDAAELGSAGTTILGLVAVALLAGFLVRQSLAAKPLMPLTIFRSPLLSGANAVQALTVAGMLSMLFLSSLYLEQVLRFTPLLLGLSFLPASLTIAALSLWVAPRLNVRFGPRNVLLAGLTLAFVGLVLMARSPVDGHYLTDVLPPMAFIGLGIGIMFPALVTLAMAGVGPGDSGLASGLINTSAQVGGALGLAILATIAAVRSAGLRASGLQPPEALASGFDLAFAVAAVLFAVAIVITLTVIRDSASDACDVSAEPCVAQAA